MYITSSYIHYSLMLLSDYLLLYYLHSNIPSSSYLVYFMLCFHFMHMLSLMSYYIHYRNLFTMLLSVYFHNHIVFMSLSYLFSILTLSNSLYPYYSLLSLMLYLLSLVNLLCLYYSILYLMLSSYLSLLLMNYKSALYNFFHIPHILYLHNLILPFM